MRLYLVRHGETSDNLNKIHQGHSNSQLTDNGVVQAKAIAERLKNEKFDIAYSSDSDRAVNTAKEILKFHPKVELVMLKKLREQSKGIYEGKPYGTIDKELERLGIEFHEFKPEKGESLQDTWDNMVNFYEDILLKNINDSVLVVGHGGPIACLITYLHQDKLKDYKKYTPIKNTAITIVEIKRNKPYFSTINCTKHIENIS